MPPRKKSKKGSSESEEPSSEFEPSSASASSDNASDEDFSGSEEEEDEAPKKKRAPAAAAAKKKAAAAPKASPAARGKKAAAEAPAAAPPPAPAAAGGGDEEAGGTPGKRKRAPAKAKEFVPPEGDDWNYIGTAAFWRDFKSEPSSKIAAFDLDGTLVNTKSGNAFMRGADDWRLFNKKVPVKLQALEEEGYKIVIFSNQGGVKTAVTGKAAGNVKGKIEGALAEAGVNAQAFVATGPDGDPLRKPNLGLWEFFTTNCNGGVAVDLSQSFFCGDAAGWPAEEGRPADFGDSDREFAARIGLPFKLPEDVFGKMEGKKAVDPAAQKAGKDAQAEGGGVNQELLDQLNAYTQECFELARSTGDDKYKWKGIAMRKAIGSLVSFPERITKANIKAVGALPAVGKGTIVKIQEYLDTGAVVMADPAKAEEQRAGGSSKRQEAALAFL